MKELDNFLFVCLRICALQENESLSESEYSLFRLYSSNIDMWDDICFILSINKIDNLFYFCAKKKNLTNLIPKSVVKSLFDVYASTCIRNRTIFNKLDLILREFNNSNIVPALWKGIVLVKNYYPDLGSRNMRDIDFQIPLEQKPEAIKILNRLGYLEKIKQPELVSEYVDLQDDSGMFLDLHFIMPYLKGYKEEEIYYKDRDTFSGYDFLNMNPHSFLSFLAEHQYWHLPHSGLNFRFFFDLLFFYRKHNKELNADYLNEHFINRKHRYFLSKSNYFLKKLDPSLNTPLLDSSNLSYHVHEIKLDSVCALWGLHLRNKAWARVILTWFKLVDMKFKICPGFFDLFTYTFNNIRSRLAF